MDTRQELLKALAESPDEAHRADVITRLYRLYEIEKGINSADADEVVTPDEAHRRMGKWLKEQYYFEMFRRHYQLPEGTICYGDKPDFILKGARKIGIELTNFLLEDGALSESEQVQSRWREAVVSEAQRIYCKNGGKRIQLSFGFDKARPIRDQNVVAKNMAELAKRVEGLPAGEINRKPFEEIPELSFVYLNTQEYENPMWQVIQLHHGRVMSRDRLRVIVSIKETKSKDYRPCDAYWLVVVVDFIDRAQDQEIRIDGFEKIDSTVFEKVIVYRSVSGHVLEASG